MHIYKHTYAYLFITCIHTHRTEISFFFACCCQYSTCVLMSVEGLVTCVSVIYTHTYAYIYTYKCIFCQN